MTMIQFGSAVCVNWMHYVEVSNSCMKEAY
jgi:hypothetical protein